MSLKPIYEQRTVSAKYKCTKTSMDRLSFEPANRQHQWGDGTVTDLVDITIILNDKSRMGMGEVKVGDVKDFTSTVTIMTWLQGQPD